jgi:hypothetical protein
MRDLTLAGLIAAVFVGPAAAQVERLPQPSRAERQVDDSNRAIARQQQLLRDNQQTQFEINQLRGDVQRSQQFPPMTGPGTIGCARGSIRC